MNFAGLKTKVPPLYSGSRGDSILVSRDKPQRPHDAAPTMHIQDTVTATAIRKAQNAFAGLAEKLGVKDEDGVQALVDEIRCGRE